MDDLASEITQEIIATERELYKNLCDELKERIKELNRLRAGVRVSLMAARSAVIKGGEVTEEMLTELIDELEVKP